MVARRSVRTPAMSQAFAMRSIGPVANRRKARPNPVTRAVASSTKVEAISTARVCILQISRLIEHCSNEYLENEQCSRRIVAKPKKISPAAADRGDRSQHYRD